MVVTFGVELFPEPVGAQCAIIGPSIAVSLLENSTSNPVTLQRALLDGLGAVSRASRKLHQRRLLYYY